MIRPSSPTRRSTTSRRRWSRRGCRHIFGLMEKDTNRPAYPNAVEYKFWTDPAVDRPAAGGEERPGTPHPGGVRRTNIDGSLVGAARGRALIERRRAESSAAAPSLDPDWPPRQPITITDLVVEAGALDWDFTHWCYASEHDASDPAARDMFECYSKAVLLNRPYIACAPCLNPSGSMGPWRVLLKGN
jgi:hypothetical protein